MADDNLIRNSSLKNKLQQVLLENGDLPYLNPEPDETIPFFDQMVNALLENRVWGLSEEENLLYSASVFLKSISALAAYAASLDSATKRRIDEGYIKASSTDIQSITTEICSLANTLNDLVSID